MIGELVWIRLNRRPRIGIAANFIHKRDLKTNRREEKPNAMHQRPYDRQVPLPVVAQSLADMLS